GSSGRNGDSGRDGNGGGFEPNCRPLAEKHDVDGGPHWDTANHNDWINANVDCGKPASWDQGLPGGRGGKGGKGAGVVLRIKEMKNKLGSLSVDLRGGPAGQGGPGGKGMRHWNGGDSFECPSGAPGPIGEQGDSGTCTIEVGGARPRPCTGLE